MYFMHRIRRTNGVVDKGIEVKETYDDARQAYHAQLSAWAYGHDPNTDFVSVAISDDSENFQLLTFENWKQKPIVVSEMESSAE